MADDHSAKATAGESPEPLHPNHPVRAEMDLIEAGGFGPAAPAIRPGVVVRLTRNVRRITASNPGYMTGPGTNTYILGDDDDLAIVDPGPLLDDHIAALLALGGRITRIFVTHTHPDHSPAAAVLKQATGATLLGLVPPIGEHQDQSFRPDRVLAHGERVAFGGFNIRVIHTPGHASNHLCYLLEEDRLLFTGDHVMQGSTVVISPPDGDMAAYIDSLRLLEGEPIDYFAPGHGFLIGRPFEWLGLLVRHRFLRENKVLTAVEALGPATIETLTPVVYDDVPPFKHAWAARSLHAHLLKLVTDGAVVERDGAWTAL